jgi:hypothetical protein
MINCDNVYPPNSEDACNKPKNPPRASHAHAVNECDHAAFAQMSDRKQVTALLQQLRDTCKTVQQQAQAGAGAAAWQPVLADMRAKLPDLTVQDEVPLYNRAFSDITHSPHSRAVLSCVVV